MGKNHNKQAPQDIPCRYKPVMNPRMEFPLTGKQGDIIDQVKESYILPTPVFHFGKVHSEHVQHNIQQHDVAHDHQQHDEPIRLIISSHSPSNSFYAKIV